MERIDEAMMQEDRLAMQRFALMEQGISDVSKGVNVIADRLRPYFKQDAEVNSVCQEQPCRLLTSQFTECVERCVEHLQDIQDRLEWLDSRLEI